MDLFNIRSNDCWMKDTCKKFASPTAPCRNGSTLCPKLTNLGIIYANSLLSEAQMRNIPLSVEPQDKEAYNELQQIRENIVEFVSNGSNVNIFSPTCGNGKTSWAIKLLQAYFNATWHLMSPDAISTCKGMFINVPKFLNELKISLSGNSQYVEHILKFIYTADIVVWDEIGLKSFTTYEKEQLYTFINARMDLGLANIFTSNLPFGEKEVVQEVMGERLYSRIAYNSTNLVFKGVDKRSLGKNRGR